MGKRSPAAAEALHRLTTPFRSMRPDGNIPFREDPSDLSAHLENIIGNGEQGSPGLLKYTLPVLEDEAIARIRQQAQLLVIEPNRETEPDEWREKWVAQAQFVRSQWREHTPIGVGAARVLIACATLRKAIEANEHPEQIAARAMLLTCEVFMAGSFMDTQTLVLSLEEEDEARREHVKKTIGGEQGDMDRARVACIDKAGKLWKADPTIRMKEMSETLERLLYEHLDKLPALDLPPKAGTIREWLKQAEKDGKLMIPEAASKAGAPKK
jgi:hypothetical protein